jgi:hypothetical protein
MFGMTTTKDGKHIRFGYSSIEDWLDSVFQSFPSPWKVRDLDGKYYGTEIEDARGRVIISLWYATGAPSARQKGDMNDEEWGEYCCDTHWESEIALRLSETVVNLRNLLDGDRLYSEERDVRLLRYLLTELCQWDTDIFEEVRSGGGPDKRILGKGHPDLKLY